MTTFRIAWAACSAALFAIVAATTSAHAIPRTFVSGTGAGATCTRAAPCATFQVAHDATDQGGEINCVDSGEFGRVNITKSITIDCTGTAGTISTITKGVFINTAGGVVRLRGLSIRGRNSPSGPGIDVQDVAALFVENCSITHFSDIAASSADGIKLVSSSSAKLFVSDSIIAGNDAHGILVLAVPSTSARLTLDNVRLERNFNGILANSGSGTIIGQIRNSVFSNNSADGIRIFGPSTGVASVTVDRSSSTLSGVDGVFASGSLAFVVLGRSTVMSNVNGLTTQSGGNIFSYQNNHLSGNVTDGAPTGLLTVK